MKVMPLMQNLVVPSVPPLKCRERFMVAVHKVLFVLGSAPLNVGESRSSCLRRQGMPGTVDSLCRSGQIWSALLRR
jgi:hypothetical protein